MDKQWYVIHTYSGHENKVKASLEERLNSRGLIERVGQILVPAEDVVEIKGGKRRISSRKFFPGYVLIEADIDDDVWYAIRDTPKVTGFLGGGKDPTPLSEEEVSYIWNQINGETSEPIAKEVLDLILGDVPQIDHRPADDLEPELESAKEEIGDLAESPEDVLSYVMFPQPAKNFLEWRREGGGPERELVAAVVGAMAIKDRPAAARAVPAEPSANGAAPGAAWRQFGRMRQMR